MRDKKGAEMTIGTIVMIILALVVLVVIIYGFTTGWSNLFDKIKNIGGGEDNVGTIVSACELSCATSDEYGYCTNKRAIKFEVDGDMKSVKATCDDLAKEKEFETIKLPSTNLECSQLTCDTTEDEEPVV